MLRDDSSLPRRCDTALRLGTQCVTPLLPVAWVAPRSVTCVAPLVWVATRHTLALSQIIIILVVQHNLLGSFLRVFQTRRIALFDHPFLQIFPPPVPRPAACNVRLPSGRRPTKAPTFGEASHLSLVGVHSSICNRMIPWYHINAGKSFAKREESTSYLGA